MAALRKKSFFTLSATERSHLDGLIKAAALEQVATSALKPNPRNAKNHPETQLALLAENIRTLGQIQPIICDEDNMILAGHARWVVLQRLGLENSSVLRVKHLTANQKRVFALADNRLAERGEWNIETLRSELTFLSDAALEVEFDLQITGFDTADIDAILTSDDEARRPDPADEFDTWLPETPISRAGDLWLCGRHKLLCGNALDDASYDSLLQNERADVVFTDPPFNVPNSGHVSRRTGLREFVMAHGEMSEEEFVRFLTAVLRRMAAHSQPGAMAYVCIDWRHWCDLLNAAHPTYGDPKNLIVWDKETFGMGGSYRSQHEFIGLFVTPGGPHKLNSKRVRARANVWKYRGVNSSPDRAALLAMHPTVKPVAMVADALRDASVRGEVVLDPFAGSGTTMIAAQKRQRAGRLMEIDPAYCDVIVRRWQQFSGESACLASGETFDEVTEARSARNNGGEDNGK